MSSTKLKLSEYYEFVRWYATPRPYRSPRTQGEFSELWKVHPATLSEWKNDPNFEEDVRRTLYEWTHNLVPEVVGAIFNTAIRGDVKAQTLFMKYFSKLPNPDKDTPEELQRTGETLADILIARVKQAQKQSYAQQPEHLTSRTGN
jgi:hypothetical protein